MKTFTKKYQVWCKDPQVTDSYIFIEYNSLEECISAPKLGNDWYITKKVSLAVSEAETEPYGQSARPNNGNTTTSQPIKQQEPNEVTRTPEEIAADELAARYTGGQVGIIT